MEHAAASSEEPIRMCRSFCHGSWSRFRVLRSPWCLVWFRERPYCTRQCSNVPIDRRWGSFENGDTTFNKVSFLFHSFIFKVRAIYSVLFMSREQTLDSLRRIKTKETYLRKTSREKHPDFGIKTFFLEFQKYLPPRLAWRNSNSEFEASWKRSFNFDINPRLLRTQKTFQPEIDGEQQPTL